jgi:hypothetical protein
LAEIDVLAPFCTSAIASTVGAVASIAAASIIAAFIVAASIPISVSIVATAVGAP